MNYVADILPSKGRMEVHPEAVDSTTQREGGRLRVPLSMPTDQQYYWRHEWQQGERESLAELDAGNAIVFDSDDPEDIVRWLREPNGPDAD